MFGDVSQRPILVADDDDFVRRFLRDVLTRQGYSVEVVPNGTEALEKSSTADYALLILDFDMGQPTGLDVINRLRAAGNPVPIILMSGSVKVEGLTRAPPPQGVKYLSKPFTGPELQGALEQALGKSAG